MTTPTVSPEALLETAEKLRQRRGEASALAVATDLAQGYRGLDTACRLAFFQGLANDFAPDHERVRAAIDSYRVQPDAEHLIALGGAVEAPRQDLFRALNTAAQGTATMVEMRADLLHLVAAHPELIAVEHDLEHLLSSWFNRGFLELRSIDWHTPAQVLEKLIEYEAVHEIHGWDDLRRRLAPDRRCFGFFHPALRDEPLIFVEVALTEELVSSIHTLIPKPEPTSGPAPTYPALSPTAHTAIFYSITNCQPGLRGISFGSFLLKQVTEVLSQELPQLEVFATLSPIPGFADWLRSTPAHADLRWAVADVGDAAGNGETGRTASTRLERLDEHRRQLMAAAGEYLLSRRGDGRPLDAVARFHLRNGAKMERVNWLGDTSINGVGQSAGMLVNYVYEQSELTANHERYMNDGTMVHSESITQLLASPSPAPSAPASR